MNLLICTQKVDKNDSILGFFHRWIEEFATHYDSVLVLALEVGEYDLPKNVEVYSLGKEKGASHAEYLSRFYRFIWSRHDDYDRVFVHMNPEYAVLGGLIWRLLGVRVGLWYVHGSRTWKLRVAEKLAHTIFSAAEESFPLASKKLHVVGHGIDAAQFACGRPKDLPQPLRVLVPGRIAPSKGIREAVEAAGELAKETGRFTFTIVGSPQTPAEERYAESVQQYVAEKGLNEHISFVPAVPNTDMPAYYCAADVVVNISSTGGLDKTTIEAMAAGALPLTTTEAFREVFGEYADLLILSSGTADELVERLQSLSELESVSEIRQHLVEQARERFDTVKVIKKIRDIL